MTESLSERTIALLVPVGLTILCALSVMGFAQGEIKISGMVLGGVVLVRVYG